MQFRTVSGPSFFVGSVSATCSHRGTSLPNRKGQPNGVRCCDASTRIAVRSAYEWHDDAGNWFRSYGNENWEFNDDGLMRLRLASIKHLPIRESDRKYHWPLGRRPDGHPGLSDLGF
jgi:hypothetical protein